MKPKVEFPDNIMVLLVAGKEQLPNGTPNRWNAQKSKDLLNFYGEKVEQDSDSDSEDSQIQKLKEHKPSSRE